MEGLRLVCLISSTIEDNTDLCLILRTEEFVAAGDFLTYKFPVWSWYASKPVLQAILGYNISSTLQGSGRSVQNARFPPNRQAIPHHAWGAMPPSCNIPSI